MEQAIRKLSDNESRIKSDVMRLEELADIHERLSTLESINVRLSRRITELENGNRGHVNDDPMSQLFSPGLIWGIVLLTAAPVILDLIREWKQSES